MKYLLGKTQIAGRQFTYNDVVQKVDTGFGQDYYGGNVQTFGRTKEGFLLCIKKKTTEILNIYIDEDLLTAEGLKLLLKDQGKDEKLEEDLGTAVNELKAETTAEKRKALIALAKELGIEGKLATMKTEVLQELIEKVKQG